MKVVRMMVQGARGEATLSRAEGRIRIEARWLARFVKKGKGNVPVFERAVWEVGRFANEECLAGLARRLQSTLDGYHGTNGDVADYLRAIQTLGD